MIELLLLQPAQISHRPALFAWIDAAMLEHEGADLMPVNPQRLDCRSLGANKIAHSLMALVGNPHCREFAGPQ